MIIKGRGGKSGGSGSEDPNTLQNKSRLRFLGLISEGPVEGFINSDPSQDIIVNNLPLKDSLGNLNYEGVSYTYRSGLPDQDHIPGFNAGSSLVSLGDTDRTVASPYTFTVTGNYDAAIVTIAIPSLFDARADKGLKKTNLAFTIQVKTASGSYVTVHNKQYVNEKTISRYEEDFRVPLPAGGSPWSIKITRSTADATPSEESKLQNKLLAARYQPIVDGKFSYRNRAILAAEIDPELFGANQPSFKVRHKGILCWVPKNYNPITRTYATSGIGTSNGTWDGTFKSAWTNNPSWVLFDILTNNRYGLGTQFWKLTNSSQLTNGPTDSLVNKWQLYVIAQYCDESVPDGYGGTEPRYTVNKQIVNRSDAFNLLSSIVSTFRGMLYYSGGQVVFTVDKNEDASFEFTQSNVVDGLFSYSSGSQKVLNSVAAVYWQDPNQYGKREVELYEDYDLISKIGVKIVEIEAFGCTSRSLARRIAKWTLLTEKTQGETVSFSTGSEGGNVFPGAIINVYDPYKSGVRAGGRLVSVTPGASTVFTVDEFVTVGSSPKITYINTSGVPVTKNISSSNSGNKTYTVSENITDCLGADSVFALSWTSLQPQKFRVVGVTEDTEDKTFSITAIKHDVNKYALIEQNIVFDAPQTSLVSADKPPTPTSISVNKWFVPVLGSESDSRVTISWLMPDSNQPYNYELQIETSTEPYVTVYIGASNTWTSEKLITTTDTEYRARVRTVDTYGRASFWRESALFSIDGDNSTPSAPTTLQYRNAGKVTELSWVNPNISDYRHTEVWMNTANNSSTASRITTISGDFYTYTHPDTVTRYFWLKTETNSLVNNTSSFTSPFTITPSGSGEIASVEWSNVTGSGKPEDNATVGAKIGTNLKLPNDSVAPVERVDNQQITINSNGTLTNAGGGQVTIGGLGYTGSLSATRNTVTTGLLSARPTGSDGDIYYATDDNNGAGLTYIKTNGSWVSDPKAKVLFDSLTSTVNANEATNSSFRTAQTTTNTSVATSITTLTAQVGNTASSGLQSRIATEETTRASETSTLATRATTLESQIANTASSGLQSRIATEETTRASADSALATRATTLEAQMANTSGSGLQSRIATEETARVTGDTALAARSDVIEANYRFPTPAGITKNSTFATWSSSGSHPEDWQDWSSGMTSASRVTGVLSPYAWQQANPSGSVNYGSLQSVNNIISGGYWVLEADVTLVSGSLAGAGVLLQYGPSSGIDSSAPGLIFNSDPDSSGNVQGAGVAGRRYSFSKLVSLPSNTLTGLLYRINNATFFATSSHAKTVTWHKVSLRPASQAEISAQTAIPSLQASVTTNTSAIATANSAMASWVTRVAASGGDPAVVELFAGNGGSRVGIAAAILSLMNTSNGQTLEVMKAVSGEAYFRRPISSDASGRRVTIGPGYGVSGSQVVLWFGPDSLAPSSQSRTNGYFALGTDGKVYYGSSELSSGGSLSVVSDKSSISGSVYSGSVQTDVVTLTVTGGSGSYSYAWSVTDWNPTSATKPSCVNGSANQSFVASSISAGQTVSGILQCVITDNNNSSKFAIKTVNFTLSSTA